MKTYHPKLAELKKNEKWVLVDAEGIVLGKLAARLAMIVRGKHKPTFHPSVIGGDHVVVVNADKVVVTGQKETGKKYNIHTGYPGSVKTLSVAKMRKEHPQRIIEWAVSGMLPKNRLRAHALKKLHVYAGQSHPHTAQNPVALSIK